MSWHSVMGKECNLMWEFDPGPNLHNKNGLRSGWLFCHFTLISKKGGGSPPLIPISVVPTVGKRASIMKVFLLMKTHFITYFPYLMVNFLTVSLLFWNAVCKAPFSTQKDEFSHCCIEANENESRESWSIWSLYRKKYGVSQWSSSTFDVLQANCFDISNLTWILTTLLWFLT